MDMKKLTTIVAIGTLMTACASNRVAQPRLSSVYDTTGFGGSQQDASSNAVQNATMTCGDLPVTVVNDSVNETQYQDADGLGVVYEVNMRYRCGNELAAEAS